MSPSPRTALAGLMVLALALLALACGSSAPASGECDLQRPCASGRTCITGGRCALPCTSFDGGGCPPGLTCSGTGPYCDPNGACPAIAVLVCLGPDGGP